MKFLGEPKVPVFPPCPIISPVPEKNLRLKDSHPRQKFPSDKGEIFLIADLPRDLNIHIIVLLYGWIGAETRIKEIGVFLEYVPTPIPMMCVGIDDGKPP